MHIELGMQNIKDAELPELYICAPMDHVYWADFWEENGYWSDQEFGDGDLTSEGDEFITWEGIKNISYEELTGVVCCSHPSTS